MLPIKTGKHNFYKELDFEVFEMKLLSRSFQIMIQFDQEMGTHDYV